MKKYRSKILSRIKWVFRLSNSLIIYYLIYNTYFGWNLKPESSLEIIFDTISRAWIFFILGFILAVVLDYIKFKMEKYLSEANNE